MANVLTDGSFGSSAIIEKGEHVLSTENYPFIKGLIKAVHGGKNPYTMDIYFINKTIKLDIWLLLKL